MMQIYDFYESLLREIAPILMLPVALSILSFVFRIIKEIAKGGYEADIKEELTERNEEKMNIDKDLQKYFNYKE